MKKLIEFWDKHILKIGVSLIILTVIIYPKFPVLDIPNTWVYIRLEDFLISGVLFIWLIQLLRKKVSINSPITKPIFVYIFAGFISTLWAIVFRSQNSEFFPHLAILHWLRRIEYLAVFFLVFSTIKSWSTFKDYLAVFFLSTLSVLLYGLGQRYFRLPAFSTMNEEFAKGIPLYLMEHSRVLSTFAGHYDLAAYLVLAITLFGSLFFVVTKKRYRFLLLFITLLSFYLLLLTFSRVSFGAYIVAISFLILLQRIKWVPKITGLVIILFLSIISVKNTEDFSDRFGKMIAFNENLVKNIPFFGKKLPTATSSSELLPVSDEVPKPKAATETAETLSYTFIEKLKVIPTKRPRPPRTTPVPIKKPREKEKAIYVDRSTSTRFDAEWPRAIKAFLKNPIFGSGYSTITLATDNDYLRLLGETGLIGFLTFMYIFFSIGKFIFKKIKNKIRDKFDWGVIVALLTVTIGMMTNAFLIDVFEASKVAIAFWAIIALLFGYFQIKSLKIKIR